MRIIFLLLTLFSITAHAEDHDTWVCTDEALMHSGSTWSACGVGEGMDEGSARRRALDHAVAEFKELCSLSSDCKGRDLTAEPKRLTCSLEAGWWKCYRMVEFTLK